MHYKKKTDRGSLKGDAFEAIGTEDGAEGTWILKKQSASG